MYTGDDIPKQLQCRMVRAVTEVCTKQLGEHRGGFV